MASLTRRTFTRGGLAVVSVGTFMPTLFTKAVAAASLDKGASSSGGSPSKTLIVIQLAGGNDGLNTVVPYADPLYHQLRPTLGIPSEQAIRLDDHLGLHPALAPLKPLWDQGHLAVVENVGYDHPSLSHFEAMDIWQSADPAEGRHQGWLSTAVGGSVDADGHPIRGVSLGTALAPALCCPPVPPPSISNLSDYGLQPDRRYPGGQSARLAALESLYQKYVAPAPYAALLGATAQSAEKSASDLRTAADQYVPAATYPATPLASGLKLLAALVSRDVGLRVGYVVLGGFDTHAIQAAVHARQLQTLAEAVAAFQSDLAGHGKADDVLVITWSEFGRRASQNASGGTDHGTAAPLLVIGSGVKGGIVGEPPDLGKLDNGNLRFATDFRSVYATVLESWLRADSVPVLGQRFPSLGFLG